jgi:NAD(P) transhydrogenase subunit alpha
VLITKEMVESMKPGSVIVDLAASGGGNCAYTKPGEIIKKGAVTIIGFNDLSATVPMHASQLYSKNILNYIKLFLKEGKMELDFENEIIKSSCIVYNGEIKYNK